MMTRHQAKADRDEHIASARLTFASNISAIAREFARSLADEEETLADRLVNCKKQTSAWASYELAVTKITKARDEAMARATEIRQADISLAKRKYAETTYRPREGQ